jgi:hypothetical protein
MANNEPALLTDNPMVDNFYDNTQSNVIRITDDKLKVILLENKESLIKNNDFLAPLTLLISLILTFCTTDFREFLTITAPVWKAFYLFLTIAAAVWLFRELKGLKKRITIDQLIEKVRKQKPPTTITMLPGIVIHKATYGVVGTTIDLTDKVKEIVLGGTIEILSGNHINGDPVPGRVKTLTVECTVNGIKKSLTAIEGASIKIE